MAKDGVPPYCQREGPEAMARAAGSDHETVARILEAIPASVDGVTSATEIATAADLNPGGAAQVNAVLMLLGVFNVLAVQADQEGEPLVKAATPLAHGFIRSLAEYVRGESIILRNWGRTGVGSWKKSSPISASTPQPTPSPSSHGSNARESPAPMPY